MKILDIRTLRGPNYWDESGFPLVQMEIDLEDMNMVFSNQVEGFYEKLSNLLPGLYEHGCSRGVKGGFLQRLKEGTLMGHIMEHVALELQTLAGMQGRKRGWARKVRGTESNYFVIFRTDEESAGIQAAKSAFECIENILANKSFDLETNIQKIKSLFQKGSFGPSTASIILEAQKRGIPFFRLDTNNLVQLGYGAKQKIIRATVASSTSHIGANIASNKSLTKNILQTHRIPVPNGQVVSNNIQLQEAIEKIGFPIVLKPLDGNHGKGASININNFEDAKKGLLEAQKYSSQVICEKYIVGEDFRVLVVNYKFQAAAMRSAAFVVGDGKNNIGQLIEIENQNPARGEGHSSSLTKISIDNFLYQKLEEKNLTLDYIPKSGEKIVLKPTANISTGGIAQDVTDLVDEENIKTFEKIAKVVGLDICGIDVMTTSLAKPLSETGGVILEVNAAPGFRMHLAPSIGTPRNVAKPVIDMLFGDDDGRIPIIAVTGTNGKTTTTRIIAHIAKTAGKKIGYTTSEGVFVNGQTIVSGDCSGPASAKQVLQDPDVELAVLETARGGILRRGLAFDKCDISVVTNVAQDHMGLGGIVNLSQMQKVKSLIARTTKPGGYTILNAQDDLSFGIRKMVDCKIALFSLEENSRIQRHSKNDGISMILKDGYVTLLQGPWETKIISIKNVPITFGGKAIHNILNVLAASLACYLQGISIESIVEGLESFEPSIENTPGRLNFFKLKNNTFLIDYAHNPAGVEMLGEFVDALNYPKKIGVIRATGDRRDEDIINIGKIMSQHFEAIVIRGDSYLRGRSMKSILSLLEKGVKLGNPKIKVKVIEDEHQAIDYVYEKYNSGELIVVMDSFTTGVVQHIQKLKKEEKNH